MSGSAIPTSGPNSSAHWDAIVIGAGLGGLSAAAHLSAAGKRTLVLEQYEVIGGSSHVFRRERAWEFDVGVHHIGDCGPGGIVPTLFSSLGGEDRVTWEEIDPKGFELYRFPDLSFATPRGWDEFLGRLIETFPDEEKAIRRFIALTRKISDAVDRDRSQGSAREVARMAARAGVSAGWMMVPSSVVFKRLGLSRKLQVVLSPHFGSLNTTPSQLPFVMYAGFLQLFVEGGSWYPRGGGQVYSAHLADVVRTHDGRIVSNAFVDTILIEAGRVAGVRLTDGQEFRAPVIVSNADIKHTMLDMVGPEHLKRRTVRRTQRYQMAAPFFNAYLGLNIDLGESNPNRDHFTFPTWKTIDELAIELSDPNLTPQQWLDKMRESCPGYIHCSNLKDPSGTRYAPPGHSSVEVMFPVPINYSLWGVDDERIRGTSYRRGEHYQHMKEQLTDIMIARAEESIPGFANSVVYREAATPITQERYTRSTEGSAYGIQLNFRQIGPLRPGPKTEIPGLFLAGSSTPWGPGTESALLSGRQAASAVLGRDLSAEAASGARFVDSRRLTTLEPDWDPLALAKDSAVINRRHRRRPLVEKAISPVDLS